MSVESYWNSPGAKVHSDVSEDSFLFYYQEILKILPLKKDSVVLDIGCGDGTLDLKLATHLQRPENFYGIDFSKHFIEMANKKGSGINFQVQNSKDLNPDFIGKFDIVFSNGVVQYVSPQELFDFLKTCEKYVKPGGFLCHLDIPDTKKIIRYFLGNMLRFYRYPKVLLTKKIFENDQSYHHDLAKVVQKKGYKKIPSWSNYRSHIILPPR